MLSLNYCHICLSCDYFSVEFGNASDMSVLFFVFPKSMLFSHIILSELCAMPRAYSKSSVPHSAHQQLCCVCFPYISPPSPLNGCSLLTGLDTSSGFLGALPTSAFASYKPVSTQATCCVMLLTRMGHVAVLCKTLQCLLLTLEHFQLRTLLSAFPSNLISRHSPLSCSQ